MAGDVSLLIIALLPCLLWLMVRWDRRQHAQLDSSSAPALRHRGCSLYPWWIILPSASAPLTIRITLRILPEHLPYREIIW